MLSLWFSSITEPLSRDHLPALILVAVFMMLLAFVCTYGFCCLNSSHVLPDLIEDGMFIRASFDVRCRFHALSPVIRNG
jgi:hypothetical protein